MEVLASYLNDGWVPNLSQHRQAAALAALGGTIRRLRKSRGISQEKLALMADVDTSYVGRVERGDNNVAILTLIKIAEALEITLSELMTEAEL